MLTTQLRRLVRRFGYDVRRVRHNLGFDPFEDMARFAGENKVRTPIIFDVGANTGQSIAEFRRVFRCARIHAFEPSPSTFRQLERSTRGTDELIINNVALGAKTETRTLLENTSPDMTSFLVPDRDGWGRIHGRTDVCVRTIDDYCKEHHIEHIDILKSDTQGFDLEVLRGAEGMLRANTICMVYLEITFSRMYKQLPSLDEIFKYLIGRGFDLVTFYRVHLQNNRAGWTDALFINDQYTGERPTGSSLGK